MFLVQWLILDTLDFRGQQIDTGFLRLFPQTVRIQLGDFTEIIADHDIGVQSENLIPVTKGTHIPLTLGGILVFTHDNLLIANEKCLDDLIVTGHALFRLFGRYHRRILLRI